MLNGHKEQGEVGMETGMSKGCDTAESNVAGHFYWLTKRHN